MIFWIIFYFHHLNIPFTHKIKLKIILPILAGIVTTPPKHTQPITTTKPSSPSASPYHPLSPRWSIQIFFLFFFQQQNRWYDISEGQKPSQGGWVRFGSKGDIWIGRVKLQRWGSGCKVWVAQELPMYPSSEVISDFDP